MVETIKRNWLLIVIAIIVVIFLFITNNDNFGKANSALIPVLSSVDSEAKEENQSKETETTVIVDVEGEVNQPGVYEVDIGARINDVIKLAGGFSDDADETPVNLAQKVHDEMSINVPKLGDISVNNTGGVTGSSKVRINYATQEEIETLSGIGPSKAQAIIQYRDEYGFFQVVEDLLEISGIGEKTLENIRDDIQIP